MEEIGKIDLEKQRLYRKLKSNLAGRMPWISKAMAVVETWHGGNETGMWQTSDNRSRQTSTVDLSFGPEGIMAVESSLPLKHSSLLDDTADLFIAGAKNTTMTDPIMAVDSGLSVI
ncbi:hypothetical protein V1515DRAFT_582952 [Lipomyces mesembrius]